MSRYIDADALFEYIQKEKAWKQSTMKNPRYDQGKYDAYYEMLKIIKEQPTVGNGWIPVSERLPEETGGCLITLKLSQGLNEWTIVETAEYNRKAHYWNGYSSGSITAWQPLPEPYKAVEK